MEYIAATLTAALLKPDSYPTSVTTDPNVEARQAAHAVDLYAKVLGALQAKFVALDR
jgi:hypothetical protein